MSEQLPERGPAEVRARDGRLLGRGNGLGAAAYVPLLEVDPRVADDLLSTLARSGVAAYVAPSTGAVGSYLQVRLPARPVDRLWVDSARRDIAARLVEAGLREYGETDEVSPTPGTPIRERPLPGTPPPGAAEIGAEPVPTTAATGPGDPSEDGPSSLTGQRRQRSDDEVFADLVAAFTRPLLDGERPWPASEDVPRPGSPAARSGEDVAGGPEPAKPGDPTSPSPPPAVDDAEQHYAPPPPPPVGQVRPMTAICLLAIVGGVLLLLLPSVLGRETTFLTDVVGVAAIVGAVAALVSRLREDSGPPADGPADGAIL